MNGYEYARRGARVVVCVLALGAAEAQAQQSPSANSNQNSAQSEATPDAPQPAARESETVNQSDSAGTQAAPSGEPTSNLPELVVDGDKKQKKGAQAKDATASSATSGDATTAAPPPPGMILGTTAPSDTGTTTFDTKNVEMRTDGGNDANTFMRNLPNVQYQNSTSYQPGATSQKTIDTKPALMSISGGRTYENNFIVNGVSVSNITGPSPHANLDDYPTVGGTEVYGTGPQSIYVPAEFVGQATVVDSNASAEYGSFQGGVVVYDLTAPPTDGYHASVSYSKDTSGWSNYILATPDGKNRLNAAPPSYDKTTLAVSVGAPITSDFAFIAQASRKEAESGKPRRPWIDGYANEASDNIFMRFAATARTDVGKFTFDTSHTDYTQSYQYPSSPDAYLDINTNSWSTKLEHETGLPGLRVDAIGLGRANLKSRAFYNTTETQNNSGAAYFTEFVPQVLNYNFATGAWDEVFRSETLEGCHPIDPATFDGDPRRRTYKLECLRGGFGNWLQGQVDYGVQSTLSTNLLSGSFRLGTELKRYDGRNARAEDFKAVDFADYGSTDGCNDGDPFCREDQFNSYYLLYPKYDTRATVNALHTFAEIDQTLGGFNLRAGLRHDYDDYFENNNFAPRVAGTVTPVEGLSFTGGYNRYYLGESLYYAIRDNTPAYQFYMRGDSLADWGDPLFGGVTGSYKVSGLRTPYTDEYTGAVGIVDPLLKGQWRLKYLERYGRDQFGTTACGESCFTANNDGESFYRSASAEYFKAWSGLRNPFALEAAAISGNVTWSEQKTAHNTFLLSADIDADGERDSWISYNKHAYRAEAFSVVTGNLDIPVRFGVTLSTVWFNDLLELNFSAGVNLGFNGVYNTNLPDDDTMGCELTCIVYEDRKFNTSLKLDVNGQINVSKEAAIQFNINNITNSTQQTVTYDEDPWVLGRSYWVGSSVRF